jgi:glucosamine-6-phosphate deaminase
MAKSKGLTLVSTLKGSLLEDFYPAGWDLAKIDRLLDSVSPGPVKRRRWWHRGFEPVSCQTQADFEVMMGHEIAAAIRRARDAGKPLAVIFPVGPMGMYRWALYFLQHWGVSCDHVHGFNMDEWADAEGRTMPASSPAAFQNAMQEAFYGPLGPLTVPPRQRHFATRDQLPKYSKKIEQIKNQGADLVVIYGIGRACHIAFWEPHFAGEFATEEEWMVQPYRLGAKLHPLTIEQNAFHSFKSRSTLVPAHANTIGPGLFLQADWAIGGCDGAHDRGAQWQGQPLWMSLLHEPTPWIPASYMPTLAGRLFYVKDLAGPLVPEAH